MGFLNRSSLLPRPALLDDVRTRYCLICCELNKREEPAFLEAMDELHRNLLIKGYRDYEECCDVVFSSIKQGA